MVNPYRQYTVILGAHLLSQSESLGSLARGRVHVVLLIDNGVTNLSGKTLRKWIHCFLNILTKSL